MAAEKTRPSLVFQTTLNASPEAVFDALFGQPQRWLCRDASIEPRVGGQLRLCWPDGCFEGHFLQFVPPATARFSWHMPGDPLPETMIVVSTQPVDQSKTMLELEHYGFGMGPDWDTLYIGAARAWAGYLKNLRAFIDAGLDLREPGE